MTSLEHKTCIPCKKGVKSLDHATCLAHLGTLDGWILAEDTPSIYKRYDFRNFKLALAFVNRVGTIAEAENHHPDITFGWGYCELRIQTHAIEGLHENDFILAAKIDA